jgi:hypothetical protein
VTIEEYLANPAVQSAVVPFLVALPIAATLRRTRFMGLAIVAAFAAAVGLTIGFTFETFTAPRKLEIAGLASAGAVFGLEWGRMRNSMRVRAGLILAIALAAVWLAWRVLAQKELLAACVAALAAAGYSAAMMESALRAGDDRIRAATTSLMLGIAIGGVAILGASITAGQFGIAVAAGAGAVLVVVLATRPPVEPGWTLALPGVVVCSLSGLLAVFTGSLPWYCLLPTLGIPWAVRLVPKVTTKPWQNMVMTSVAGLLPAALSIGAAWFMAGSTS